MGAGFSRTKRLALQGLIQGRVEARRVGSDVHHWQAWVWRERFPFGWVILPMITLNLNYFQQMCLYTGQWVTFCSPLLPGTVASSKKFDCQPNPMTHHGTQNELAELRQVSSNKWAESGQSVPRWPHGMKALETVDHEIWGNLCLSF